MRSRGLALLVLLSLVPPATAQDGLHVVQIKNHLRGSANVGSGTIVKVDGERALVISCRHLFGDNGKLVGNIEIVRQKGDKYEGRLLGVHPSYDLSAIEIADPGDVKDLVIAPEQPEKAVMGGYAGGSLRGDIREGNMLAYTEDRADVFYSFVPEQGDSGGGMFDSRERFAGVVWGTNSRQRRGIAVSLMATKEFLASPVCKIFGRRKQPQGSSNPGTGVAPPIETPPPDDKLIAPGPPGPQGPAGPTGPAGPPGASPDVSALLKRLADLEASVKSLTSDLRAEAAKPILVGVTLPDGSTQSHVSRPDDKFRGRIGLDLSKIPGAASSPTPSTTPAK
jgi:hypothetical protein